jgi:hypothetical protein
MFVNLVIEVKIHFWMNPKTSIKIQNFILVLKGETHCTFVLCTLKVQSTKSTIYTLRVHIIQIEFAFHCTFVLSKVQNPEFKPGYNLLLLQEVPEFRLFYVSRTFHEDYLPEICLTNT